MKAIIIQGSPRKNGNTAAITKPFSDRLEELGWEVENLWLGDYNVKPCLGCYACQNIDEVFGCVQKDDAERIWNKIASSDLLVLSTPIYTWYCTAQMKNLLDRHYGVNKFYGKAAKNGKHSLAKDLSVALITTHGYAPEYANDAFEIGMSKFCKHSKWNYLGIYSERDGGGITDFKTPEIIERSRAFADKINSEIK